MPTIEQAVARHRRQIAQRETVAYRAMREAYGQAVERLVADLQALVDRIEQAQEAHEAISEAWLRREQRYQRLLEQTDAEFVRVGGHARAILLDGGQRAILAGADDATALLRLVGVDVTGASLNVAATERLVASFAPGSPVSDVLRSYGKAASATIKQRLVEAVTGGLSPRSVARQIARDLDSPMQRARLLALVRNESMRSYRGAVSDAYQSVGHLLDGVVWICDLSPRTCKACLGMHLSRHPVGYVMETHVACRCTVVASVRDMSVALPPSGDEWLVGQPVAVRRDVLGPAFDHYERGDITLADFVQRRDDPWWGRSVTERSARDVLRRVA